MSSPPFELTSELVRAGAGAGKTELLARKVIEAAKGYAGSGKAAPRIVVTTFTKKATEELRERLMLKACAIADLQLVNYVTSPSLLHISTIHGVLSLFLRRYGHLVGIDSHFEVLDESLSFKMQKKILRDILSADPHRALCLSGYSIEDALEVFAHMQEAFAAHPDLTSIPVDVLLNEQLSEQSSVLGKLSAQIKEMQTHCTKPEFIDYYGQLEKFAASGKSSSCLLAEAEWEAITENLGSKPRYMKANPPYPLELHEHLLEILEDVGKWFEHALTEEDLRSLHAKNLEMLSVFHLWLEKWQDWKISSGQMEMSDLESLTAHILKKEPGLADAFRSDWDYWLIDEYQDTSPLQIQLIEYLRGDRPEFLVGDPQQSIYLFRGARSDVFDQREKTYLESGRKVSRLQVNYRSCPELLEFFNDFFSRLPSSFQKMLPHSAVSRPEKKIARFLWVDKKSSNINAPILNTISEILAQGAKLEDICVLGRRNLDLLSLAQDLESWGVPVRLHSTEGFYLRREIVDALSLLKFLLNPHDNENLIRLLRSPYFKVADEDLANALGPSPGSYWLEFAPHRSSWPSLAKLVIELDCVDENGFFAVWLRALEKHGYFDWCADHDSTGRREANLWKLVTSIRENLRKPGFNLQEFVHKALSAWDEKVETADAVAALEPNRVQLMTVHKAKGLKFKHVILPNVHKSPRRSLARAHERKFLVDETGQGFTLAVRRQGDDKIRHPALSRRWLTQLDERERQENLRVLYVALTRAVESVSLHGVWPPEKGSWAEHLAWAESPGTFATDRYTYTVSIGEDEVRPLKWAAQENTLVRAPWQDLAADAASQADRRRSVTQVLEERDGEDDRKISGKADAAEGYFKKISKPVFGMLLHRAFESRLYKNSIDDFLSAKSMSKNDIEAIRKAMSYIESLSSPPMKSLLTCGEAEWGFQVQTRHGLLEGQVDLWGKSPEGVWLVDYKSGTATYPKKAMEQLEVYAYALSRFGVSGPFHIAALFALEEKVELRHDLDISAIEKKYGF